MQQFLYLLFFLVVFHYFSQHIELMLLDHIAKKRSSPGKLFGAIFFWGRPCLPKSSCPIRPGSDNYSKFSASSCKHQWIVVCFWSMLTLQVWLQISLLAVVALGVLALNHVLSAETVSRESTQVIFGSTPAEMRLSTCLQSLDRIWRDCSCTLTGCLSLFLIQCLFLTSPVTGFRAWSLYKILVGCIWFLLLSFQEHILTL